MKSFLKILILICLFTILNSCDTTEFEYPRELIPYVSLAIGDIRQYYDDSEGIYLQYEVIDTTKRIDGQKVFKMEQTLFLPDGFYFRATLYYFIKENFFIATDLDTVSKYPPLPSTSINKNKFNEQKLAEIFPQNGDYFLRNDVTVDSQKVFFKVSMIDSIATYCGKFTNVAQYEVIDSDPTRNLWIYYAPVYGHVGSIIENNNGKGKIFAKYLKVNRKELGIYTQLHLGNLISNPKQKSNRYLYLLNFPK
jgi:hypothetical protein